LLTFVSLEEKENGLEILRTIPLKTIKSPMRMASW